jgi:hypothetical protein
MERALNTLSVLPVTKSGIEMFAGQIIEDITEGNYSPIKFEIYRKSIEKVLEIVSKDESVKNLLQNELDKYPEKTIQFDGLELTKSTKTNYDYSQDFVCAELDKKLKERKELLKALKDPLADTVTGEILYPPIKTYSYFTTVKFK